MAGPAVDWQAVRAVVFDVDGTLYDQRKLRLRMARELALSCLLSPARIGEARILRTFRKVREALAEEEAASVIRPQHERTAERLGVTPDRVERVVAEWILDRPLRHLAACRHAGARRLFSALRGAGRSIGVWSDYPAAAKLAALGLAADACVSAADPEVDRLKPRPEGLARVLEMLDVAPASALMIGDRDNRDGEAARRLGCPYLLLVRLPATAVELAGFGPLLDSLAAADRL